MGMDPIGIGVHAFTFFSTVLASSERKIALWADLLIFAFTIGSDQGGRFAKHGFGQRENLTIILIKTSEQYRVPAQYAPHCPYRQERNGHVASRISAVCKTGNQSIQKGMLSLSIWAFRAISLMLGSPVNRLTEISISKMRFIS